MSELSTEARALIEAEAGSDAPSSGDKARVRARIAAELGAGVFVGAAVLGVAQAGAPLGKSVVASLARTRFDALWLPGAAKLAAIAGAAGALYAGVLWVGGDEHRKTPERVAVAPLQPASSHAPAAPSSAVEVGDPAPEPTHEGALVPSGYEHASRHASAQRSERPAPSASATTGGAPRGRSRSKVVSGVAEPVVAPEQVEPTRGEQVSIGGELKLLARAQRALRSGDAKLALALAREHAASFADGTLKEERTGIETLARCMLGEDAGEAARAFLAQTPSSPLAARVREECKLR